jgi:hypothetical protein
VVAVETAVPTNTPTPLPTSIVLTSGEAALAANQGFDFDTGQVTDEEKADVLLQQTELVTFQWTPMNSARFAVFGLNPPGELECQYATLTDEPLNVNDLEAGIHLCYRTSQGLPGMLKVDSLPASGSPMNLTFITWAVP